MNVKPEIGFSFAAGETNHPFNWDIEFPEVFDRDNPGFDALLETPFLKWK